MKDDPEVLDPERSNCPMQLPVDRRGALVILWHVLAADKIKPLAPPEPAADLADMPLFLRLYACLRLFLLDIEFATSSAGHLRGVAKLACRIAIVVSGLLLAGCGLLLLSWLVVTIAVVVAGMFVELLQLLIKALLLLLATIAVGMAILFCLYLAIHRQSRSDAKIHSVNRRQRTEL